MNKNQTDESGQVVVLLVLGVVALIGFAALAIDGGMIYAERRRSQNAADASALTGAGTSAVSMENYQVNYWDWNCSGTSEIAVQYEAKAPAISQAAINDYAIDYDVSDHNGVKTDCEPGYHNGSYVDKWIDVTTMISSSTDTAFVHFVFDGPVTNQVEAVARARPRTPLAYGYALVSLREDCPNSSTGGIHFSGNNDVDINGGGVFSNSCIDAGGSSLNIQVVDGEIIYVTDYTGVGHPTVNPEPSQGSITLPDSLFLFSEPDCSSLSSMGSWNGGGAITPGIYSQIRVNSGDLTLAPGLYCLNGDVKFNTNGVVIGDEVTFYLISGDFQTSGGAELHLSAPPISPDPSPAIPGMLIYLDETNGGIVSLLGNASSYFTGTVYAPNVNSMVEVGGSGAQLDTYSTQLIAGTINIHGSATIDINFNDDDNYQIPARIELNK